MDWIEELERRVEFAQAFERGERVMRHVDVHAHKTPYERVATADDIRFASLGKLRIAPRTIRIGDRDVPMPTRLGNGGAPFSYLTFESIVDRIAFDDAVMRLVREGE